MTDDEYFFKNGSTSDDELANPTNDPNEHKNARCLWCCIRNDITSFDLSAGYKAIFCPQMSESLHDSTLHSRDTTMNKILSKNQSNEQKKKNGDNITEENPMDFDKDNKTNKNSLNGKTKKKSRGHYYNPLVYYTNVTGKTYYFQYFKAYSHDYRLLKNETECQCPRGKIHHSK